MLNDVEPCSGTVATRSGRTHFESQVLVTSSVTRVFMSSVEVKVRVTSNSVSTQDVPTEARQRDAANQFESNLHPCVK